MWPTIVQLLVVVAMAASLALLPIGLPGVWLMVGFAVIPTLMGEMAPATWAVVAAVAAVAEVLELVVVKWMGDRAGGSKRAFWGAVAGGFLGLLVGLPVPVVGPVLTAFLGTFIGAGLVTLYETRSLSSAGRVGWSVVLARTAAVAIKMAAGLVILAMTVTAMVWG